MKVLKPDYYDEFECIGSKCKDNCCHGGWAISVDKKSYMKYKKYKGEYSKEINKGITRDRRNNGDHDYAKIELENLQCTFLNGDNLCDIYINCGEDYMCNTCKSYPRIIYKYNDICEKNLSMSCPEIARKLVERKDGISFDFEEERLNEVELSYINASNLISFNKSLYNSVWEIRSFLIGIAQNREIEIWKRLIFIRMSQERFQKLLKNNKYDDIYGLIENLEQIIKDESINESLDNIKGRGDVKSSLVQSIIEIIDRKNSGQTKFFNKLDELNKFVDENNKRLDEEFEEFINDKSYILENFIVYNLYSNFMKTLNNKNSDESVINLIVVYSIIRELLILEYSKNNGLSEEDIIDTMYLTSRLLEHSYSFFSEITKRFKEAGYDELVYLAILVK